MEQSHAEVTARRRRKFQSVNAELAKNAEENSFRYLRELRD
jgi:hypothetical protein